jgi:AcrR family transcriptional regulator
MPGHKAAEATRREQILKAAYHVALHRGIDGLTVRAVAARAKLSHGLVLFHFNRKDQLGLALLDRVLATTVSVDIQESVRLIANPHERLQALCRLEMARLLKDPRRIRLLLEYWARGTHNAVIREKISAALEQYRSTFREIAAEAASARVGTLGTPAGLAAVAVSLILGFPVQAIIDPHHLDVEEYLASVQRILGYFAKAA